MTAATKIKYPCDEHPHAVDGCKRKRIKPRPTTKRQRDLVLTEIPLTEKETK